MQPLVEFARIVSLASFLFYGIQCLFTERMKLEFKRYGLDTYRKLTGVLQIAGAMGLILGIFYPFFTALSSAGLCVLMLLGMGVRIRIRDPWYLAVPALTYALLNLAIFLHTPLKFAS